MKVSLLLILFCLATLALVDARGRGGSSRSSRSSSRSRSSTVRGGSRYRYSTISRTNFVVVGYPRYYSRYHGTKHWNADPTVCSNNKTRYIQDNGTLSDKPPGYFICPFKSTDSDDFTYCCGPEDEETCCNYWGDAGRTAGAVIGIIIGVVFVFIVLVCVLKTCCKSCGDSHDRSPDVALSENADPLMGSDASAPATVYKDANYVSSHPQPYSTQQFYSHGSGSDYPINPTEPPSMPQPDENGKIGFEGIAPPSYNDATKLAST